MNKYLTLENHYHFNHHYNLKIVSILQPVISVIKSVNRTDLFIYSL